MSQFFQVHPVNPQTRLIRQAVEIVRAGGVIAYPTDSAYALGCQLGEKSALERIRRIPPRVALVQLGDWHREPQSRYDRGMIGDGRIPLSEIVHAFTDAGYAGHFEVNLWSEQIWQSDYDRVLPLCRSRFDALAGTRVG